MDLTADPEQAEVDQPDRAGGDPIPVERSPAQVVHGGGPQRGQRGGEPQHVVELLRIALLPP